MTAAALVALLAAAAVEPALAVEGDAKHPEVLRLRALEPAERRQWCKENFARALAPEHPQADEAMYESARCVEAMGKIGPALRIDEQLAEKHREGRLGRLALAAVGRERLALLKFARAAEAFEEYAARYAADKLAPGFLRDAAGLRSGLGMMDQAQRDLEEIERLYSRSAPRTAAEAFWARRELLPASYATDKALRAHAESYLKIYGDAGDEVRKLLAIATLGEIDWRASCKIGKQKQPGPLGLCVELKFEQPTLCDATVTQVVVHPRDRKLAGAAVLAFERVIAAAERMDPYPLTAEPRLRDAVAMAKIRLVDRNFEAYLAVHMPEDLSFTVDEWRRDSPASGDRARYEKQVKKSEDSKRRFLEFNAQKTRLAIAVEKEYEAVFGARSSPAGMFAAAARVGLLELNYGDELMQADTDLPPGPEARAAFCEALEERIVPMSQHAITALSACVAKARVYGVFDDSARFCEAELQRRALLAFPPLRELFAEMQALEPGELETIGVQVEPYGFGEQ